MKIAISEKWIEEFKKNEDPYIIYQNIKWNFIKATDELAYIQFYTKYYWCEFEMRKDVEQLSLFNI